MQIYFGSGGNLKILNALKHSQPDPKQQVTDSCYVSVVPTKSSIYRLLNWLASSGETLLARDKMNDLYSMAHVTIMYSKNKGPDQSNMVNGVNSVSHHQYDVPLVGTVTEFEEWDGHNNEGYLVAKIDSPELNKLHEKWKSFGCEHSFPDFEAHTTIISPYANGSVTVEELNDRLKDFPIVLEFVNEQAVPIE